MSRLTNFRYRFQALMFAILVALLSTGFVGAKEPSITSREYQREPSSALQLMSDGQTLLSPDLQQRFPRLKNNFEVRGPSTKTYNCIAHSLGIHDRWVNPVTGPESNRLAGMDALYASQGYRRLPHMNVTLERGKQKVVVYATLNPDATIAEITHAALQEADGTWTSKLGSLALIRHQNPELLRGIGYGLPVAVYVRTAP